MKKRLNIITALLLCINTTICTQNATLRVKPTDASGVILAGQIRDNNHVSFEIQQVGYDWCAITAATSTLISLVYTLDAIKTFATEKECRLRDVVAIGGLLLSSLATRHIAKDHERSTHGQHWFKSTQSQDVIELEKRNETWHVLSRRSKPNGLQKLSNQEVQQLAEAIIVQQDSRIKEQDLYTSPIFEQLVSSFKAQGTK